MPDSLMPTIEDRVGAPASPKASRPRWLLIVVAGCLLLVCALVAGMLGLFSRHASPYAALDAYTSAVTAGDRGALDSIIGDGPRREALIDRHADKPMTPTSVSMEMMVSAVWWSVEIRYELPGQQPYTEHLLVHPRSDSPDRLIDYVVEPAPWYRRTVMPLSVVSEPLLRSLPRDVECGTNDGPGVARFTGGAYRVAEFLLGGRETVPCRDDAAEGRGVARRVGGGLEVVQAGAVVVGLQVCHVIHLISDSRRTSVGACRRG